MIDNLIRWSLHNRAPVLVTAGLLCVFGTYTAFRLPVDVFPDLTAPTVTILCEGHGMAPADMETQVTFPIEAALNGAAGVRRVRSSTAAGIAVIWVEFGWDESQAQARRVVNERLSLVAPSLPEGITPTLAPISSIMGEIMFLGLVSDVQSPLELRTYADTRLRRRLLSVPGVSQVMVIGGEVKQYQVILSPEKLLSYGISLAEVARALKADNENVSAGFLNAAGSEYIVSGRGRFYGTQDIEDVVIRAKDSVPILVRDLGEVVLGGAPKRGEGSIGRRSAGDAVLVQPAVVLSIQKQPGANTLDITAAIDRVLDDISLTLPEGIEIERDIMRQSRFIKVAIRNVLHALRDGGILVVLVMLLFLANVRATMITLTAIPLSLVAAILTLEAFGANINTMTLGGMAIAVGALVDDAVIDVENVMRRLRQNALRPPAERQANLQVVFAASKEIRNSILFATLIVILVFVPIFFLPGVEGRLLQPLGMAYVVALFASLVVALTVTPALCLLLLPSSKGVSEGREPRLSRYLKRLYQRLLLRTIRHPWIVTTPVVLLFAAAVVAFMLLGRAFLPDFNEGALTINATTVPGISLPESDRLGRLVEKVLLSHPEVISTARRTGRAELDEHAQGVNAAEIDVSLELGKRSKEELLAALRRDLSQIPGVNITIGQPISHRIDHMLSGTRASLAVKIFGPDLYELRRLAEKVRAVMDSEAGIVDLAVEQQSDIPLLLVSYRRDSLARHGLSVATVSSTLEAAYQGLTVSRMIEGQSAFDLVIRLGGDSGWSLENIGDLRVDTPAGAKVPLSTLASIRRDKGPNTISREKVQRKIVVQANVSGRDITSVVKSIRQRVDPIVSSQPGYRVEYGGQFESAEEAGRALLFLGFAVVLGIGLLLHLAFRSARDALIIMVNLPLALIGAVAGVYLSGGVLSVASMIGFITVFGIATRNGIMLVSHIRHLQREEDVTDFRQAVIQGSVERLLPILMTALSLALALVPLALGGDKPGNEIQTPMAVVILGGLVSATFLNMIVVPAVFLRFGKAGGGENQEANPT